MTELSPQAQAVLDAAISVCHPETETVAFQCTRLEVAAALRAVANDWRVDTEFIGCFEYIRASTLERIAAELEGTNPTNQKD
jgi:hypothetical protein